MVYLGILKSIKKTVKISIHFIINLFLFQLIAKFIFSIILYLNLIKKFGSLNIRYYFFI